MWQMCWLMPMYGYFYNSGCRDSDLLTLVSFAVVIVNRSCFLLVFILDIVVVSL